MCFVFLGKKLASQRPYLNPGVTEYRQTVRTAWKNAGTEVTCEGLASHPGGVAILLVASCYGNLRTSTDR